MSQCLDMNSAKQVTSCATLAVEVLAYKSNEVQLSSLRDAVIAAIQRGVKGIPMPKLSVEFVESLSISFIEQQISCYVTLLQNIHLLHSSLQMDFSSVIWSILHKLTDSQYFSILLRFPPREVGSIQFNYY
jgi:hypothetical protein